MSTQSDLLSVRQSRCYMQFDELELKCYKPDEVRRISVMEVRQVVTFDESGFPVKGGLYDPKLGSMEDHVCETCGLSSYHCPGHFGHIELSAPVFNPLLFSFISNLMKGTCVHCHRFTFDTNSRISKVNIAKIRALSFGVPEVLDSLEGAIRVRVNEERAIIAEKIEMLGENTFLEAIDQLIVDLIAELVEKHKLVGIDDVKTVDQLRDRMRKSQRHHLQLKNDLAKRNEIVKDEFLKKYLLKRKTRCPRCKRANGVMRNDQGRAFILDFSKQSKTEAFSREAKRRSAANISHILAQRREEATEGKNVGTPAKPSLGFERPDADYGPIEHHGVDEKKFPVKASSSSAIPTYFPNPTLVHSNQLLADQLEQVVTGKCTKLVWRAMEVREHLRLLWERESTLLKQIFPFFVDSADDHGQAQAFPSSPVDALFIETVMVEPSRFRPIRHLKGDRYEHPTTVNLRKLMEANRLYQLIFGHITAEGEAVDMRGQLSKDMLEIEALAHGKTMNEKLHFAYLELQMRANVIFDEAANKNDGAGSQPGLRQTLEKKEGLFRMNMMGKRVNYACRSVITPDPYLDVDEIGIPELFARRLTFPEPVSYLNHTSLRDMVRRGPNSYPGANFIEHSGKLGKPPYKVRLIAGRDMARERGFQSTRLHFGDTDSVHSMPDIVLRHLKNGDRLLMNRQPSLHKPSIMGHRARILGGQKALRMNYAPCKAYNADFDGDEMNGHFVQNRVAQCEVAELANVGSNFLVPKDGTPILGLIQDHVVSGVLLTIRGRFLDREDFMHLLLSAFAETGQRLHIPKPSILWPQRLWSGKQLVTAIVQNCCPPGQPLINLAGKAKTSLGCWKAREPETNREMAAPQFDMSESEVVIRQGELLCGVLDKAHYGATQFGLIHCCYELYGPKVALRILSCFSRAFTTYLQFHGFSLGVADILVTKEADKERRRVIRQLRKCGDGVVRKAFGLAEDTPPNRIRYALATAYNHPRDRDAVKLVDYTMKQAISKFAEQINGACVPSGLIRAFPTNALQLMIQSGAKGSLVNSIQISCALGQIELEGQRPPLSITGRSLPSFPSFDPSPRAGGFVEQRFLTGISPQELFFHTMAGREGLVDTAVKTSRSGYLQRCIIKHLEGITIRYDHTVRDYDNSVVQFRYGEDGLDVGRATFLNSKQFPFLYENTEALQHSIIPRSTDEAEERGKWRLAETEQHHKRISKFKRRRMKERQMAGEEEMKPELATMDKGHRESAFNRFQRETDTTYLLKDSIVADWRRMGQEEREKYEPKQRRAPPPVDVLFHPTTCLGALPESSLDRLNEFMRTLSLDERARLFKRAIYWKSLRAFADPGECVGLLAAQSIGEPSTQMTLNTFHFAGRGEMNVTLGIPRLREILMTQSKNISTPMAEVCIRAEVTEAEVEQLKSELNPVMLKQVLKSFVLEERMEVNKADGFCWREYHLQLELLRSEQNTTVARRSKRRQILREIERRFGAELGTRIKKTFQDVLHLQQEIQLRKLQGGKEADLLDETRQTRKKPMDDDLASDEEDAIGGLKGGGERDADELRLNRRHLDDAAEYEGEEQDKGDAGIGEEEEDVLLQADVGDESEGEERAENDVDLEEGEAERSGEEAKKKKEDTEADRKDRHQVATKHDWIADYAYDAEEERWCRYVFRIPQKNKGCVDVQALVEREIDKFVVMRVLGVEKCVVREEQRGGRSVRILQTQGISKEAFYNRMRFLDVNTIYSNDINWVWVNYGIEAAMRTIVKEMNNVFGVYGIEVNPRHLTLTADYMTFTGAIQAFNRTGMEQCASPLQKMTFETTVSFMQKAIVGGQFDPLFSPSARIVLGQLIRGGTGSFDLLSSEEYALSERAKKKQQPTSQLGLEIMEMRRSRKNRKMEMYQQHESSGF